MLYSISRSSNSKSNVDVVTDDDDVVAEVVAST